MLSNTDHLAEAESAKAREQDALQKLAAARLEIERLRSSIERYCKMIIEMGADGLFLGDNPTLITVAEAVYSAHMQVKNGTAVRSSTPPDTDTVPVDVRNQDTSEDFVKFHSLNKAVILEPHNITKLHAVFDEYGHMVSQPSESKTEALADLLRFRETNPGALFHMEDIEGDSSQLDSDANRA